MVNAVAFEYTGDGGTSDRGVGKIREQEADDKRQFLSPERR